MNISPAHINDSELDYSRVEISISELKERESQSSPYLNYFLLWKVKRKESFVILKVRQLGQVIVTT